MGFDGGMVFDARPYQPDAMDRQRHRQAHPLGEEAGVRPPWLPTPPEQAARDRAAKEQASLALETRKLAAVPVAGVGRGGKGEQSPPGKRPNIPLPSQRQAPPRSAPGVSAPPPPPQVSAYPPPPPPVSNAAAAAAQEQPSTEDLFALYRLCGGDSERVVELLARLWGSDPNTIAPTVYAWLGGLPPSYRPPPSRSRTAPPALPSWFTMPRFSAINGVNHMNVRPDVPHAAKPLAGAPLLGRSLPSAPIKPVPLSAPAVPSAGRKESYDMMMLQQAVANGSSKLGMKQSRTLTLQPMPEDAVMTFSAPQWNVPAAAAAPGAAPGRGMAPAAARGTPPGRVPDGMGEDALGAFMYESRMGKGIAVAQRSGGVRGGSYGGRHMR